MIPSEDSSEPIPGDINVNVFRNLDSPVSEGGENFSTGYARISMFPIIILTFLSRGACVALTARSSCFAWLARS